MWQTLTKAALLELLEGSPADTRSEIPVSEQELEKCKKNGAFYPGEGDAPGWPQPHDDTGGEFIKPAFLHTVQSRKSKNLSIPDNSPPVSTNVKGQ